MHPYPTAGTEFPREAPVSSGHRRRLLGPQPRPKLPWKPGLAAGGHLRPGYRTGLPPCPERRRGGRHRLPGVAAGRPGARRRCYRYSGPDPSRTGSVRARVRCGPVRESVHQCLRGPVPRCFGVAGSVRENSSVSSRCFRGESLSRSCRTAPVRIRQRIRRSNRFRRRAAGPWPGTTGAGVEASVGAAVNRRPSRDWPQAMSVWASVASHFPCEVSGTQSTGCA